VRAVKGDGDHEGLLFFENGLTFTVYHILLICATTQIIRYRSSINIIYRYERIAAFRLN
jgi:hypothetical protein